MLHIKCAGDAYIKKQINTLPFMPYWKLMNFLRKFIIYYVYVIPQIPQVHKFIFVAWDSQVWQYTFDPSLVCFHIVGTVRWRKSAGRDVGRLIEVPEFRHLQTKSVLIFLIGFHSPPRPGFFSVTSYGSFPSPIIFPYLFFSNFHHFFRHLQPKGKVA